MLIPCSPHRIARIFDSATLKLQILIPKKFHPLSFLKRTYNPRSTQDVYASNVRIAELFRDGKIESAHQLFDEMPKRDVVSWNAMVTGYWQNGYLEKAKLFFQSMPVRNVVTWNSMITSCFENELIDEALGYFSNMPEKNTRTWNAMISGFVRCGRIDEAARIFEEIPRKNVISYTAMIDGYAQVGEIEKGRALFDRMRYRNVVCWTVMITGYVENGGFDEAKKLFDRTPEKNVVAMTSMIIGYCMEGELEKGRILFNEIKCKDQISYNAMISGYAQNGYGEEALNLFIEMLRMGMHADHFTLISILIACSSLASLETGRQIHVCILKKGFVSYISVCNALITAYSKCGSILDSELSFSQLKNPDLVSFNTIIAAFAQHGLYEKSVVYHHEMRLKDIEPDAITFLSLLSSCGHSGLVNESLYWFDSMVKMDKILPRPEHYACLVDMLSRAGHLQKAYDIIRDMPFEADLGIWGALLSGCCAYSNSDIGELAAKKLLEFDPKNSGAYVALSNIYAEAGLWKDVKRVRSLMKEHEVKKQPAFSWLEIANEVHFFCGR